MPLKNYLRTTLSFHMISTTFHHHAQPHRTFTTIVLFNIVCHTASKDYLRLHVTISFLLLDCTQRYHLTMLLTAVIHLSLPDNRGQVRQVLVHIALSSITTRSLASASPT